MYRNTIFSPLTPLCTQNECVYLLFHGLSNGPGLEAQQSARCLCSCSDSILGRKAWYSALFSSSVRDWDVLVQSCVASLHLPVTGNMTFLKTAYNGTMNRRITLFCDPLMTFQTHSAGLFCASDCIAPRNTRSLLRLCHSSAVWFFTVWPAQFLSCADLCLVGPSW